MHIRWILRDKLVAYMFVGSLVVAVVGVLSMPSTAQAACSAMPKDKGQVSFSVDIPSTGVYQVWSRIYSPTASANGFYIQIDQAVCKTVVGNGGPIDAGKFTWVNWTDGDTKKLLSVNLEKGKHTIIAAGLDANLSLDKVMFLTDTACIPKDTGTNCDWMSDGTSPSPSVSVSPGAVQASPTPDANGNIPAGDSSGTGKNSSTDQKGLVAGLVKYWPWIAGGAVMLAAIGAGAWFGRKRLFGKFVHKPQVQTPSLSTPMPTAPPAGNAGDVSKPGTVILPRDPGGPTVS